jgi:DNA-binding IscR family transcriptional regulator
VDEDDLSVVEVLEELHPHVRLVGVGRHRPQERHMDVLQQEPIHIREWWKKLQERKLDVLQQEQ